MADSRSVDEGGVRLTPVTPAEDMRTVLVNQVSWGAVFAGIVVALIVHLLLTMIGAGIGLVNLNPGQVDAADAGTFSTTAGIWWIATGILAALAGGYTAGRLSGRPKESTAAWHGIAAWAGSTIIVFYLLTTAVGGLVGGILNTVGGLVSTAAEIAGPTIAAANPLEAVTRQLELATPNPDPAAARTDAINAVIAAITADEDANGVEHQQAIAALAQATGTTPEAAQQRIADLEAQADAALQSAADAAETASNAVGTASIFAAIALILGGIAAAFGGRMGKVQPTVTDARRRDMIG